MASFADNFHNVKQRKIPKVEVDIIERNGMNIIYNPKIDDIKFNRKNSFKATSSIFNIKKVNEWRIPIYVERWIFL